MNNEKTERPGGDSGAFEDHQGAGSLPIVSNQSDDCIRRSTGYAVFVEDPHGHYRRRLFLSLRSVEKAVARAQMRGRDAKVVLVHLNPIEGGEGL